MRTIDGIGRRLRACREALGYTQTEMGRLGGVERNTQANYEVGRRAPDAEYLASIAQHGAHVAWIITGEGEPCTAASSPADQAALSRLRHATTETVASFEHPAAETSATGRLTNTEAELLHGYRELPEPDRAVVERVVTGLLAAQAA